MLDGVSMRTLDVKWKFLLMIQWKNFCRNPSSMSERVEAKKKVSLSLKYSSLQSECISVS